MYIGSWFYKIINLCPLFWDLTHFKVNICNLMFYFEQISNMPLFTVYLKMLWNCEILKTYDYYLHSAVIKIFSYTYNKYFSTVSFYWSSFKVLLKWRKLKMIIRHTFFACGILLSDQGLNPGPRKWELQVLTTGLPGNSLKMIIIKCCLTRWKFSESIYCHGCSVDKESRRTL